MPAYLVTKDSVQAVDDLAGDAAPRQVVLWARGRGLDPAACGNDWIVVRAASPEDARRKVALPLEAARLELSGEFTLPAFAAWVRAAALEK